MEQDLKDALKYISDQGYGNGTNWNTKLVAVLLANYRNKLASDGDLADVSDVRHVCGLQGFGLSLDDECPACRNMANGR